MNYTELVNTNIEDKYKDFNERYSNIKNSPKHSDEIHIIKSYKPEDMFNNSIQTNMSFDVSSIREETLGQTHKYIDFTQDTLRNLKDLESKNENKQYEQKLNSYQNKNSQ